MKEIRNFRQKQEVLLKTTVIKAMLAWRHFTKWLLKLKIGKLFLANSLKEYFGILTLRNVIILPISATHVFEYNNVTLIETHRDPFDRIIKATAISENLAIVTIDKQFDNYKDLMQIIW